MSEAVRTRAEVVETRRLSPTVCALRLRPEAPLHHEPGQWIDVQRLEGDAGLRRAYSIANAPREDGTLEIAVTRVEGGALSPALHALVVGDLVQVHGPHGFFVRDSASRARPALFVGTGTGLAPLRAMLEAEAGRGGPRLSLLFGCRSTDDILWASQLREFREGGIDVEVTLSRGDPVWQGRRGYVQAHVEELARSLGEPEVYICGLSKMVKEVRAVLKQRLGYDRKRIHSERYD